MRRLPRNLIFIKFQIHYTGLHHVVLNVFMIWFLFWPWILPLPRQCCLFFLILPHKKSLWDLIPHRSKQHLLFPGCCAKKTYPRENTATTLAEQILYWAQCSGTAGFRGDSESVWLQEQNQGRRMSKKRKALVRTHSSGNLVEFLYIKQNCTSVVDSTVSSSRLRTASVTMVSYGRKRLLITCRGRHKALEHRVRLILRTVKASL